jgi:hypothetical protein
MSVIRTADITSNLVSIASGIASAIPSMPVKVVPGLSDDLVSISSVVDSNGIAIFDKQGMVAIASDEVVESIVSVIHNYVTNNNLITFTGLRTSDGLYSTDLAHPLSRNIPYALTAHKAAIINTVRCPTIKSLVHHYYCVLGYPS